MRPLRDSVRDATFSIREISDRAGRMDDAIRLDIGQPDFGTPEAVKRRMQDVIVEHHITYTPLWGINPLRKEIADYENGKRETLPEHVMVTTGGTGALFCILDTVLSPGDEVLLNDPVWPPYKMVTAGTPGSYRQAPYIVDGAINADGIRGAITEDTAVMVVNSPENPSGRVFTEEQLQQLGAIAAEHDLYIISDEVYDRLVYDDAEHHSIAGMAPERTFLVNSVSKTFAMTGWRLGWVTFPDPDVIHELGKVNRATTASPNYPAQQAALAALREAQDYAGEMRAAYQRRKDTVMAHVEELGWDCPAPRGAIYVFPDVGRDSWDFALELLEEEQVAVVPGATAGTHSDTNIRLCFGSVDVDGIEEAFDRIERFVD